MKDNYGDKLAVEPDYDVVFLKIDDHTLEGRRTEAQAELTPAKARKLAKKLRAAADEIDPPKSAPPATAEPTTTNALGYRDGDVVMLSDIGAVLRYDAEDDAWYSAGPEAHDCSNDFDFADPDAIVLIARVQRVTE